MGNYWVKIKNETPDTYSYYLRYQVDYHTVVGTGTIPPYGEKQIGQRELPSYIYIRYGQESGHICRDSPMLTRDYNAIDYPTFFIRPSGEKIRLVCDKGGTEAVCDNIGEINRRRETREREQARLEEERRQRQEQERLERERRQKLEQEKRRREEQQRRERIEKERQIQQQISEENAALRNKLGRAAEKRRLQTSLSGKEDQRSRVIAQTIDDDAEGIQYDEEGIIAKHFRELLDAYDVHVQPSANDGTVLGIKEQMRRLADQLVSRYCKDKALSIWFHTDLDETTQFNSCSLTDQLAILETLLGIVLKDQNAGLVQEIGKEVTINAKHALIVRMMASLESKSKRVLSTHLFGSYLDAFAGLSQDSKQCFQQIVYNSVWTPLEAIVFLMRASHIAQDVLVLFMHKVRTYRIGIDQATTALMSTNPMDVLQNCIEDEEDKSLTTVIEEMRQNGVPENILKTVREVVEKVITALPSYENFDTSDDMENSILSLKKLDFSNLNVDEFTKILIGLSIEVHNVQHYFPRITQLVSLVTLLISKTPDLNGCLLEISTGEGKSCIIAMLAVILALRGSAVDIVTSSPLLAMRDAAEWKDYYHKFHLSAEAAVPIGLSTCKTPDEMDAKLASAYKANIVYGTVGSFTADTLKQEFEKKDIRGSRRFEAVIVDEVDFMTLDNGVQITFLSHASGGMRHVEQVLASVWSMVSACRPVDNSESGGMVWFTNIQHIHKAATSALVGSETSDHFNAYEVLKPGINLGFLTTSDFDNLQQYEEAKKGDSSAQDVLDKIFSQISPDESRDLLTVLESALDDVAFECYTIKDNGSAELFGPKSIKKGTIKMLLLNNGLACELLTQDEMIDSVKRAIGEKIKYSDEFTAPSKEDTYTSGILYVPQFLKAYIQNRTSIFVRNALTAIQMTKGREYTIDRTSADNFPDSPGHQFDCIIPVDFKASGVLEKNKRWGDGLQQFLEMKHQVAMTPISTVTNFLSNFNFFKRYSKGGPNSGLFGASGTLGDKSSCDFLRKHFMVTCFSIPTHRHKKLVELPVVQVVGGEDMWLEKICQKTKAAIRAKPWCKGQASLVVCEDMKTADKLKCELAKVVDSSDKITMYTRSDKHSVESMDFEPGNIIIATNLGGRGTNFSVTEDVNESGGLFVLLTHLPSNRRVEKQIFGRTARKGRPGSAQMVLNVNNLARAYQGQGIDTMRQLREEYERERIANMEKDELLTIEIREDLFAMFCERLDVFSANYEGLERGHSGSMIVKDLHSLTTKLKNQTRMDCKPAQNAFKETWAQWLILNEHLIEDNGDMSNLKKDLVCILDEKQQELQQGISSNFYDHTRQALGRMYLHEANLEDDCGTIASWDRAIKADMAYRAVASYNKAYIIINMGREGYMDSAIGLLKDTIKAIDVHIAENANTMTSCHFASVNGGFKPHNQGETNSVRQFEIRNSFFKIWLDYTAKAIDKLQGLKDAGDDAMTEEKGIFALIDNPDPLEANELQELFNEGLQIVYDVKKKPKFCIDALICFILGVLQVFAGILVCVLSFGSATNIGMGIISEGVSDLIAGIEGMITGAFDWAEWAISKAISIGLSLLTAGFSKIKDAACAVAKGVKAVLAGTKKLSSIAHDVIKAGKTAWKSAKSGISSAAKALSKESVKTLATSEVSKRAMKYAVQEVIVKGVEKGVDVGVSKATEALFEKLLSEEFDKKVGEGLRESKELNDCLIQLIVCYGVPERVMEGEDPSSYEIPQSSKTIIQRQIKDVCERVIPELTTDNAIIKQVFSQLKEIKTGCKDILSKMDKSGRIYTVASIATEIATHSVKFATAIQNIPTKEVMQKNVVPELKEDIDILMGDSDAASFQSDDKRSQLKSVQKMKESLMKTLTEKIAEAFTDACASNLNSFLTDYARSKLSTKVSGALNQITGRYDTHNFFKKQQEQYHNKKMQRDIDKIATKPTTKREKEEMVARAENLQPGKTPSIVELKAMVASDQLGGKGLQIDVVDADGKTSLTSVNISGSDSSKGTIRLRLVRENVKDEKGHGILGKKGSTVKGHFEIVNDDGTTAFRLSDDDNNTVTYAVAKAVHQNLSPEEVEGKANLLRKDVGVELSENPEKYAVLHRRQKEYEDADGESAFFSLPAKSQELDRKDAKPTKDNSFSLTKARMLLMEKSAKMCHEIIANDKVIIMTALKHSISLIQVFAKPIGDDKEIASEVEATRAESEEHARKRLLYLPSKTVLEECSGKVNACFEKWIALWSQGKYLSMAIPEGCEELIVALVNNKATEGSKERSTFEVYRNMITEYTCTAGNEDNAVKLLKVTMICSHPNSVQDILAASGLVAGKSVEEFLGSWGRLRGYLNLSADEGVKTYFKVCFLIMLNKYKFADCLLEDQYQQLVGWVEEDGFLDSCGPEYKQMVDALKLPEVD